MNSKLIKKESEAKIPADLRKFLGGLPDTKSKWLDLTPIARRDFISWIESAKQAETRKSRIERIPSMLSSGKRRPCCFAVVPMSFYKALGLNSKAKAQWKTLTPSERRDLIDWIESVKDAQTKTFRIEKTCMELALGKRKI